MAYKILLMMKRRPGMSPEEFRDYYETRHVPLATKYSHRDNRYIRRYLIPQPHAESGRNDELPYDVITELAYEEREPFERVLAYLTTSVMPDEVIEDEAKLFDRATMRIATVIECETAWDEA